MKLGVSEQVQWVNTTSPQIYLPLKYCIVCLQHVDEKILEIGRKYDAQPGSEFRKQIIERH